MFECYENRKKYWIVYGTILNTKTNGKLAAKSRIEKGSTSR